MAKKDKEGLVESVLDLAIHLPWWVGGSLAAVSYFGLHHLANQPAPVLTGLPGQATEMVKYTLVKSVSTPLQYLLPGLLLVGAAVSAYRSKTRQKLFDDASGVQAAQAVDGMSWREFEVLVGEGFRRKGFGVQELGGQGPDGGVDLVLAKGSERYFVQCKQWRANKVGVSIVRELYGVMSAKGAAGGMVVTSGSFTTDAKAFARGRNMDLIDGPKLLALLKLAREGNPATLSVETKPEGDQRTTLIPVCPKCRSAMKLREAKQGPNAGQKFWGCETFPKCRGTLPFEIPE
ncbi:MAG: restriction endonuclease [Burkholderiales bacterium]|nr:restriction endonuclease [Burkholderiales bacterium]